MRVKKSAYQAAGTSSKLRIGFGDRKGSGMLRKLINELVTAGGTEITHLCRVPGSVAAAEPARTPANPDFGLRHLKNQRSYGTSNLSVLLPA